MSVTVDAVRKDPLILEIWGDAARQEGGSQKK